FFSRQSLHGWQMQRECSVNPPLSNRIATQFAVLGIAPGPLCSLELFLSRGPTRNPSWHPIAAADSAVHEEVGLQFVSHQSLQWWVVEDRISLGVPRDMPVVVEKEAHLSWMSS